MKDNLLSVPEAKQRILDSAHPVEGHERVALRSALNRVLGEDIRSPMTVPPHDNSAMDGYAVRAADCTGAGEPELRVVGKAFAGAPWEGSVQPGECVRIMTGAVVPAGADTVIMQEQVEVLEENRIRVRGAHNAGSNVRYAGEELQVGDVVLTRGQYLGPAELGLLASLGIAEVTVCRRLRVAFFSTGDELKGVGEPLGKGDIYDSNRYALHGMLSRLGVEVLDMGVIRDRREDIEQAFRQASQLTDAVITSGGVSVGEADFVKQTLDTLGQVNFWRVAMKPGKPLAAGRIGNAFFFGLPGNPVSAMATFYQFVQPALEKMMGRQPATPLLLQVPCQEILKKQPGRLEYQRGILEYDARGQMIVRSTGQQDSHRLTSMSRANCFIILPAENAGVQPGDLVQVQPFAGLV